MARFRWRGTKYRKVFIVEVLISHRPPAIGIGNFLLYRPNAITMKIVVANPSGFEAGFGPWIRQHQAQIAAWIKGLLLVVAVILACQPAWRAGFRL
ncbi:MAG TPA: hypothetical protein VGY56_05260 [Verrucomicrobiae bacterium]|nr:hypothetical protein [Verrucomicrobiae bacterium]